MGRVYKAWDRDLEKVIALKTIRGEHASNPEVLKRFKQELCGNRRYLPTYKRATKITNTRTPSKPSAVSTPAIRFKQELLLHKTWGRRAASASSPWSTSRVTA